jgi:hypothetical protein
MLSLPYRAEFDIFTTFSRFARFPDLAELSGLAAFSGFSGFAGRRDEDDDGRAASTQIPFQGAVAPSSSAIGTRGNSEG